MTALQYDEDEDAYYLIISGEEYGPFEQSELIDTHECLHTHFS